MVKKLLILIVIFSIPFSCNTQKNISKENKSTYSSSVDSNFIHKENIDIDSSKEKSHVQKENTVTEEYSETSVEIKTPLNKEEIIDIDGVVHFDTTSTLDSIKYCNDKNPKTSILFTKDASNPNKVNICVQTPKGVKVYDKWTSISINSKKWKRTTTGKTDSVGSVLLKKLVKNTFDSGDKKVDTSSTVLESKIKNKKTSFNILSYLYWIIPIVVLVIIFLKVKDKIKLIP